MKLSRSAAALATAAILAAAPVGASAAAEPTAPPTPATTAVPPLLDPDDLDRLDGQLGALLGNLWWIPRDLLVQLPCTLRSLVDRYDPCRVGW